MKNWRKVLALMLVFVMAFSLVACGNDGKASEVVSEVESAIEEVVSEVEDEAEEPEETEEPEEEVEVMMGTDIGVTPRNETVYYNGVQWGTPIDVNPFSTNSNNGLIINQTDLARVLVYETLFMYNQGDASLTGLVAEGQPEWNADMTEVTVKLKGAAKWSDGTPVTAEDVKATFDAHVKVSSPMGTTYSAYISEVVVVDDATVTFKSNPDNYNPNKVKEYLPKVYVCQKAYLDSKFEKYGDDTEGFKTDKWDDLVHSGAYKPVFLSSQKVVIQQDENYWGQDASMWGKLAEPKYIVHNIFKDNDAGAAAFRLGEVDVAQQFMAGVPDMWNKDNLPVSTYLPEPLCYQSASMPSIWFNTTKPGLDQKALRQAIAYAVDYDQINQSAMYGYSPTFEEAPRSIAVPLDAEQKYIDNDALVDYQWGSMDYDRSNALLDEAGMLDTDGDGIREYNGEKLEFQLMCPKGWTDWQSSLEIVAAAGAKIGLSLSTNFVETAVWTESLQTGDFDIIMNGMQATSIASPWARAYSTLHCEDPNADRIYWGYSRMKNDEINTLIETAAAETDEAKLKEYYTEISKFLLDEMPVVALMYRPSLFHTVNETVWTGFQEDGDGTNIPPQLVSDGYGYAALYQIHAK